MFSVRNEYEKRMTQTKDTKVMMKKRMTHNIIHRCGESSLFDFIAREGHSHAKVVLRQHS